MKQALSLPLVDVPRETEDRLRAYLNLLVRWNARINLVAPAPAETLWQRHVLDSLQLLPLIPEDAAAHADIGSGAGFPGLVLAAMRAQPVHLIESDRRKCAFLQEAARTLGVQVTIHPTRIEDAQPPPATLLTARALAPLPKLLALAHPLLAPGAICLFPKGRTAEQELTEAAPLWNMRVERFTSRTDSTATILRLSEISPVGAEA